jgi:hypothetical protein
MSELRRLSAIEMHWCISLQFCFRTGDVMLDDLAADPP